MYIISRSLLLPLCDKTICTLFTLFGCGSWLLILRIIILRSMYVISIIYSFLFIPFYEYSFIIWISTHTYSSVGGIWVSSIWSSQVTLLRTLMCKSVYGCMLSFLWDRYLGVKLMGWLYSGLCFNFWRNCPVIFFLPSH